jgi:ribonuclease VapC
VILDTSAIIAIVGAEPSRDALLTTIEPVTDLAMSAATRVELAAVLARSRRPEEARRAERLLSTLDVEIVAFDAEQARIGADAYRIFGRGTGHRASLNMGDCYSYALAITRDEPLLFVGDGFQHTDVRVALTL